MNDSTNFDVIVVGGGHAGCEAALVSARMGVKTLLISSCLDALARMPCNPSIGGLAKSHLVYELDALGGEMGRNADATALQAKLLNLSRGPAVWATRCQCAKQRYTERMQSVVRSQINLFLLEDDVINLKIETNSNRCSGVITEKHGFIQSSAVVITSGTSLRGRIWIGKECIESAGDNRPAVNKLSESLEYLGFKLIRLKTGTPPRLKAKSCDFSCCVRQDGDSPRPLFHVEHNQYDENLIVPRGTLPEFPCWMTHTTAETHDIIRNHLKDSSLYGGSITGTSVRYCPSIEDKIVRFKEAEQHHVILEPETSDGSVIYPNGLSCSLPKDVQHEMVRSVPGLENAEFMAYAYAIEYDSIESIELRHTLESKKIEGLFFAGQINGTTGYEEAAAQGIMAGANAVFKVRRSEPLVFSRQDAYIGVMIDDLVTKGTDEPYRMFTSRAERRLILRQDNARFRLLNAAERLGIIEAETLRKRRKEYERCYKIKEYLKLKKLDPLSNESASHNLTENFDQFFEKNISGGTTLLRGLGRAEARPSNDQLQQIYFEATSIEYKRRVIEEACIMRHYEPYIEQERKAADQAKKDETIKIPRWLDYDKCTAVRFESREKLKKHLPETLAQAAKIPGVNPADVSVLAVIIKRGHV